MGDFTRVIARKTAGLMLHRNLLLFLRMLAVSSVHHSAMNIASNTLLVTISLILWLFLNIVSSILLIPILRIHNIIIIYMLVLVQRLLLPAIMRIVNLVGNLRIVAIVVHLVARLNHIDILMIAGNVMRLQMVLFFQDVDVLVCGHDVGVWHRIVEVLFVVAYVLLG